MMIEIDVLVPIVNPTIDDRNRIEKEVQSYLGGLVKTDSGLTFDDHVQIFVGLDKANLSAVLKLIAKHPIYQIKRMQK